MQERLHVLQTRGGLTPYLKLGGCAASLLTLVCNISPSDDERAHLEEILRAFADDCAYIHATIPTRITKVMRMQAILYYDVRGRFGLSSNLAQQAFRRVAANRKVARAQGAALAGVVVHLVPAVYTSQAPSSRYPTSSRFGELLKDCNCEVACIF